MESFVELNLTKLIDSENHCIKIFASNNLSPNIDKMVSELQF
jgi:hypothetical protein